MSMDPVLWNILPLLFLASAVSVKSEVLNQAAIMNCTLLNEVCESDVAQGLPSLIKYGSSNINSTDLDYIVLCQNRKILKTLLERLMLDTGDFSLLEIGIVFNNTTNFNEPIACNNISTNLLNLALTLNNTHLSKDLLNSRADPYQQDGFGNTALHLAVFNKNMPIIRAILQNNSEGINMKNNNGETPLFISAFQNDTEILKYLLAYGAEAYSYNNVWTTPLHIAAEFGNNDIVRAILRKSVAGVNAQSKNGLTALFLATLQNNIETCKLILDSGAFPYIPDDNGTTPLHEAIRRGYLEIAESMLKTNKYGANYQDRQGSTALSEAAKRNATKIANLLIEAGSYPFVVNNFERTALHEAAARGHSEIVHLIVNNNRIGIDWRDNENATALYLAVKNNSAESCEILLNAGADPKITDNLGNTPLHVAAEYGFLKAAQVILKSNIDLINITNNEGNTSLILASNFNRQDIVRYLLLNNAGVNIVNNYGWSSLFTSVYRGYSGVAEVLSSKKECINFQNGEGKTALHIASAYNKSEVIQLLIQSGALSLPDNDGWIPLHYSAANNHLELIDTFLSLDAASIDVQNFKGNTALHLSAAYGKVEAVIHLLRKGANPCIVNYLGEIPLHVAVDMGNPIIILDIINSSPPSIFDTVDGRGLTPLLRASQASVRTFQFLLEKGANPFKSTPRHGSALHYAAEQGNLGIAELILRWFPEILDHLHGGMTPLHQALLYCERNKLVVNYLLKKGAKTVISTVFGNNVLHFASRYCGYDTFRLIFRKSEEELKIMSRSTVAFINEQNYIGTTPLFQAALAGNEEIFQFLWSRGGNAVLTDSDSCSLLVYASKGGEIKIIQHILKETNISVNKNCYDGLTPLMAAAYSGNVEAFEFLVENGATLGSITEDGNSVLHYAAGGKGCCRIISTIISKTEINVNMRNLEGFTPIMYAVKSGNFKAFKFLMENTNADLLQENIYGDNTITLAAREGNTEMLQSLNFSSYDVDVLLGITLARSELPTNELLTNFLSKSSIAKDPQTYAIAKGELTTLQEILPQNNHLRPSRFPVIIKEFLKDYNRFMTDGNEDGLLSPYGSSLTSLDIALLFFKNMKVVKTLFLIAQANCSTLNFRKMMLNTFDFAILAQQRNNLNDSTIYFTFQMSKPCLSQSTNKYGWTLVHKTSWIGNRFFLHFLESQGIDFDRPDVFGRTPLHIAALKGDYAIVNRILSVSDNSINSTDVYGYTPLHLSQIYLYKPPYSLPNVSLTRDPQVSFKTNQAFNFLSLKDSSNSHIGIIWTLAYHHANLNTQDNHGWTPLHWAAAAGDIMSVILLVSLGATVNTPSFTNQTPMEVARVWGRKVVYNYLKQHGAIR